MERRFDNLAATNAGLEANRAREIKELKSEIALAFEELKKGVEDEGQAARAWSRLAITAREGQVLSAEQHILNSLRFNTMDYRHAAITKEHQNTLHWVFDRSSVNVVEWLEGNNNLYWISGKPGSGKSTLMKFLWNHEQAEAHLNVWAGADTLIVASFYFWSPAKDSLQKSQTGLLRSILYQILRRCSELIRVAFPDPLQSTLSGFPCAPSEFLSSWQLLTAFERLSSVLALSKVKFCFFIDGLDEYEGAPVTIIQLVEILKRSPNVKICVSSRPWNEFEETFGMGNSYKLYVHDFTRNDIQRYVDDVLGQDPRFQELRCTDDKCPDLVKDIVDAAQGVFLWVFLVVRSLLEGLTNADRIKDLRDRLREIPTDLQEYFEKILSTVDVRYRQQMAWTFMTTLEAHRILPLMCYWVMDQEDSEYAWSLKVGPFSKPTARSRVSIMERRLNARCKGLIEVGFNREFIGGNPTLANYLFDTNVDFLHRTVRDFLRTDNMQKLLHVWSGGSYNVDLEICKACIVLVKGTPRDNPCWMSGGPIETLIQTFFHHVKQLEDTDCSEQLELSLIDELDRSMQTQNEAIPIFRHALLGKTGLGMLLPCIQAGVRRYVTRELEKQPWLAARESSLLLKSALLPKFPIFELGDEQGEILQLLLRSGTETNLDAVNTVWILYLRRLSNRPHGWSSSRINCDTSYNCIRELLTHGAEPDPVIPRSGFGSTTGDFHELIRDIFGEERLDSILDLISNLEQRPVLEKPEVIKAQENTQGGKEIKAKKRSGFISDLRSSIRLIRGSKQKR
jgi:hypothetical protein